MKKLEYGFITNNYDKLMKMTEPIFRWLAKVRRKLNPGIMTLTSMDMARRFWFKYAMVATREAKDA